MALHILLNLGFVFEVPRSHPDTPHSAGHHWLRDCPVAETSTGEHTTLTTVRQPCRRRDSDPQSRQANGRRTRGPGGRLSYRLRDWNLSPRYCHMFPALFCLCVSLLMNRLRSEWNCVENKRSTRCLKPCE